MQRWVLSAALSALLTLPVWGQRGGGGHGGMGGGGHGGMSMGGGVRGFSGGGYHGGYAGGSGYRGGYGGYARVPSYGYSGGYRGYRYGGYGYGYGWRGYPYRGGYPYGYGWRWGYPWWGWGYAGWGWYPWWGWGWDYGNDSYYSSYPSDAYAAQTYPSYVYATPSGSDEYSQAQTQDEISDLKSEVDQLKSQQAQARQGKMIEIHSETVLVYRDGHREEVENYAIVGKTLWIFNETRARKIALSELDLPATKRDNEDRGIEFVVPNASR